MRINKFNSSYPHHRMGTNPLLYLPRQKSHQHDHELVKQAGAQHAYHFEPQECRAQETRSNLPMIYLHHLRRLDGCILHCLGVALIAREPQAPNSYPSTSLLGLDCHTQGVYLAVSWWNLSLEWQQPHEEIDLCWGWSPDDCRLSYLLHETD